jgi:hypothetical protein
LIKAGNSIAFLEAKLFDASNTLIATGMVTAQLAAMSMLAQKGAGGPIA